MPVILSVDPRKPLVEGSVSDSEPQNKRKLLSTVIPCACVGSVRAGRPNPAKHYHFYSVFSIVCDSFIKTPREPPRRHLDPARVACLWKDL